MAISGKSARLSWLIGHHFCSTCTFLRSRAAPPSATFVHTSRRLFGGAADNQHLADEKSARQWAAGFISHLDTRNRQYLRDAMRTYELEHGGVEVTKLTQLQIRQVFLYNSIPFIGFGFLDNAIMILAGEYIDLTFGALFSISTMAAAALGNLVSDVCGVGLAGYVELIATRFGVATPNLTAAQYELKEARWSSALGRAIGVCLGCLLGMFPLLFFTEEDDEEEEDAEKAVKSQESVSPCKACDAAVQTSADKPT